MARHKKDANITGTFADRLSDLIADACEKGKIQKEIANDLGISEGALSGWASGLKAPTLDNVIKLVQYFCVSADWLLGTENEDTSETITQQVKEFTGLSSETVEWLHIFKDEYIQILPRLIDKIVCGGYFRYRGQLFTSAVIEASVSDTGAGESIAVRGLPAVIDRALFENKIVPETRKYPVQYIPTSHDAHNALEAAVSSIERCAQEVALESRKRILTAISETGEV